MTEQEKREKVIKGLERCVEKLDTVVNKHHGFNCIECPYFRKCENVGYLVGLPLMRDALALLKAQEPVVHGRWTEQHVDYASDCAIDEVQSARCSVCGLYHTTPYLYNITNYAYCPNCGAKMDGDTNG